MYISVTLHWKCVFVVLWPMFLYTNAYRSYCLSEDSNPYNYFATKTPYEFVRSTAGPDTGCLDCKPIQIWILSRHGTRFPQEYDIPIMKYAIKLRQDILNQYNETSEDLRLCPKDLSALKDWMYDDSIEKHTFELNEQGWKDLYGLGERYKLRYPTILAKEYDSEDFYFKHTYTQRTEQSCKAFIDGLFGIDAHKTVKIETPVEIDMDIKPYDNCEGWRKKVDKNKDLKKEYRVVEESEQYKKLQKDISERLGFATELPPKHVCSMYDHCRFEKTRHLDRISPWCSVFSKSELQLMEYKSDVYRYHNSGYGHEYNIKLGCPPLRLLKKAFEKTIAANGVAKPATIALFTHDTMLSMVFAAMGYAKDMQPLKGKNFEDLLIQRHYRTSLNIPFTANMVAILHQCENDPTEEYKVQFFLNERPMILENCPYGLCKWKDLEKMLPDDCDLSFCYNTVEQNS